jgi:glycosyltransferase involved in cell wall biosynthesis
MMSRRSRNFYQLRHKAAAWLERWLHRRMTALVGNSQAVVDDLVAEGAPQQRVRLIQNGIDTSLFAEGTRRMECRRRVRTELGIGADSLVLVCVANLFRYKGHADLITALQLLGDKFDTSSRLLCVGRDAGEGAKLGVQVAAAGLEGRVVFMGARHDVPDLLAAADIGVLASHEEGFSNAVLEGMAAGLPMVVTNVGGNGEAVVDEDCGYLVPASHPAALAAALGKLMSDSERRTLMGNAGRKRVSTSFSIDACVAAYEGLYENAWTRGR